MIEMYERSPRAISWQAVGDLATTCLPSRLSRVRAPSPAFLPKPSLCKRFGSQLKATRRRDEQSETVLFLGKRRTTTPCLPKWHTSCLCKYATPCFGHGESLP